jgi:hypothetical protein
MTRRPIHAPIVLAAKSPALAVRSIVLLLLELHQLRSCLQFSR